MIKNLNKIGNSKGIIIDNTLLELLEIEKQIEITLVNNTLVLSKPTEEKGVDKIDDAKNS